MITKDKIRAEIAKDGTTYLQYNFEEFPEAAQCTTDLQEVLAELGLDCEVKRFFDLWDPNYRWTVITMGIRSSL